MAKPLVIPVTAALVTGTRAIVYVEVDGAKEPTYEGREVLLGPRAGDYYLVRNGLFDGEMVVTNGNFKIDSALQIQAKPTMMTPEGGGGGGGHHHGGETKKPAAGESAAPMGMELPEGFAHQLHELVSLSEQVSTQTKSNDLATIQKSFADFLPIAESSQRRRSGRSPDDVVERILDAARQRCHRGLGRHKHATGNSGLRRHFATTFAECVNSLC